MFIMDIYAKWMKEMGEASKRGNARQYVDRADKLGIPIKDRDPHLQEEVDLENISYHAESVVDTSSHPFVKPIVSKPIKGLVASREYQDTRERLARQGVWD